MFPRLLHLILPPLLLAFAAAAASLYACRAGSPSPLDASALGLFVASLIFTPLLVAPAAAAAHARPLDWPIALAAALLPWVALFAIVGGQTETHLDEWAYASLILAALAVAVGGCAALLAALGVARPLAAGLAAALALAWVTWPIWTAALGGQPPAPVDALLSDHRLLALALLAAAALALLALGWRAPRLAAAALLLALTAAWLTRPAWGPRGDAALPHLEAQLDRHPGLAINAQVYRQFGSWTEQSVAYHLTDLNQSVPYTFPPSPWPMILTHLTLGLAAFAAAAALLRRPIPTLSPTGPLLLAPAASPR